MYYIKHLNSSQQYDKQYSIHNQFLNKCIYEQHIKIPKILNQKV
jgi:hypothetical protein